MMGIGGKTGYLDELYELYDSDETIGEIALQERVRLVGCTFGEAQDYYDRQQRANEVDATHDHLTGMIKNEAMCREGI